MSEAGALRGDLSGLPPAGLVVVGFSGGADSTALAHWLAGQVDPARLLLAHVNHRLRGEESERDEAAARAFAQERGLRLAVFRAEVADLARERGLGLEACGRQVRYDFFENLAAGEGDRILTAHTADDNAETVLLHLCRGAGLDGLCGIPPRRGKILRPLLGVTRGEIEAYCAAHGLLYVTDSSNASPAFARNRVRQEVLPLLEALNPQAALAINRAAGLLRRDRDCLEDLAARLLETARDGEALAAPPLREAPGALRDRALKRWLEERGCRDLERRHLALAVDCLENGGSVQLPGGVTLHRRRKKLLAFPTVDLEN